MTNYEDYLKQVADLGGANNKKTEPKENNDNKKKLADFYHINKSLISSFYAINNQIEQWINNRNLDEYGVNQILNSLNQHKADLASLKFEVSQTDIADYEGNTRTKLEKQLTYIKNEMVLEEANLVLQNLKQLKTAPKAEPKQETPKNDSNFLRTFLKTEYGKGYTYEGDLLNHLPHGTGTLYYHNRQVYKVGTWSKGKLQNNSKVYFENGQIMEEGIFKDNLLHGIGKKYYKAGLREEGYFVRGHLNGIGTMISYQLEDDTKLVYTGTFNMGLLNGNCKCTDGLGRIRWEGHMENHQLKNGRKFKVENHNGRIVYHLFEEGDFSYSFLHGQGKRYNYKGEIIEQGQFINGIFQGK